MQVTHKKLEKEENELEAATITLPCKSIGQ
jgi:hypothetical protein